MKIDSLTYDCLQNMKTDDPIWEKVEFLVLELIERGYLGNPNGADVTSMSNDGRSESYESNTGKAGDLIRMYLPSLFPGGGIIQGRVIRG